MSCDRIQTNIFDHNEIFKSFFIRGVRIRPYRVYIIKHRSQPFYLDASDASIGRIINIRDCGCGLELGLIG